MLRKKTFIYTFVFALCLSFGLTNSFAQTVTITFTPNTIANQSYVVGIFTRFALPSATGGTAPYTYSLSPALPAGLSFDAANHTIRGTPTTTQPDASYTYTATDAAGNTGSLTFTINVPNGFVYWTEAGTSKIRRANLDGTHRQDILTLEDNAVSPDLTVDVAGRKLYWTEWSGDSDEVRSANLDGTSNKQLASWYSWSNPAAIGLDLANGYMYIGYDYDVRYTYISQYRLGGSFEKHLVDRSKSTIKKPRGITVDPTNGRIYFAAFGSSKIYRVNPNGTGLQAVVTGAITPTGITLDTASPTGKLYWTNYDLGTIQRADRDGTNVETLVTSLYEPWHIALDAINRKMYWTEHGAGIIQRANMDGSNVELVLTGLNNPAGIGLVVMQASGTLSFSPATIADQNFTVGTAVNLTLPSATGGTSPYAYTLTPALPAGLQFDAVNRTISGTPTAATPATPYTYIARDAGGGTATLTFQMTVTAQPGALTFSPNVIGNRTFTIGTAITPLVLPEATGGTAPYTYALAPIPAGLAFDTATRSLSGTPTTQGPTSLTYTVADAAGATASLQFIITVTPAGVPSDIPDANLAAAVRRSLGLASDTPLTAELMQHLTTLDAYAQQVTSLTGLEQATNLTTLDLGMNQITDISTLSSLTQLTHLYLDENQITDVSALSGLSNLRLLRLAGNPIQDTSPIAALLQQNPHLDLDIVVTDPPPATGVTFTDTTLATTVRTTLGLGPNDALTTAALQNLILLEAYNLRITSIAGLEHATNLTLLDLGKNEIVDISPLAGLTQLEVLYLDDNKIEDVSPLAGLTKLNTLFLSGNPISSLEPISHLIDDIRVFRLRAEE